ncbi:MAG: ABC transporter permease [Candidatus Bathyarchaeota archaeon]|nr:ABC transporter permease [Candidatus Bathyarchaeota archaeon]
MAGTMTVCQKELADHIGSKRYIVLFALIIVLSTLSAYQGAEYIRNNPQAGFIAIFSGAQFGFSFASLMVFFGPIIGLALGFDAINKERTSGSLSVLLSQPIYRDSVINGKFLAGTAALSLLTVSTTGIMCGVAIPVLGFGPALEDVSRIALFTLLTVLYLAFWMALGLLYSTATKKTTTSILMSVSTWLVFSIVITIVASLVANTIAPVQMPRMPTGEGFTPGGGFNQTTPGGFNRTQIEGTQEYREQIVRYSTIQTNIQRISPAYLYNEASSSILGIIGGGFGFIGQQGGLQGRTPFRALELTQGLMGTWPQITAIAVYLVVCFAASYMLFLRLEIRPGG